MIYHTLSRGFGNFGVGFFSPLVGGNVAETMFEIGLSFEQTLIISFIASLFTTGLYISKEMIKYGEKRKKM